MIFWSLVFLVISLIVLIKGNLMNNFVSTLNAVAVNELDDDGKVKYVLKVLYMLIIFFILTVVWIIYLLKALTIDIYIYPTLFFIAIFMYGVIRASLLISKKKSNKKSTRKRTFIRTIQSTLKVIYICYILWLLIF